MQMVRTIVDRKLILFSVNDKTSPGNPVGISSRNLSRTRPVPEIARGFRITQNNIRKFAILVRNNNRHNASPHIGKLHICSAAVLNSIKENVLTAWGLAPQFFFYFHISVVFLSKISQSYV